KSWVVQTALIGMKEPRKDASAVETAASPPLAMSITDVHPKRNAGRSPYASLRNTYSPPASGIIAPSSAYVRAPASERSPAASHASRTFEGDPTSCAIGAVLRKTPVPMTVRTRAIASRSDSALASSLGADVTSGDATTPEVELTLVV